MNDSQVRFPGASRPDAPIISDIAHLGGRGSLYLLALVQAHQARQRVTPTQEGTAALLSVLDALGVVRAEHRQTSLCKLTIGDNLPWSYTWPQISFDGLEACLTDYLTTVGRSAHYSGVWLSVWQQLVSAVRNPAHVGT